MNAQELYELVKKHEDVYGPVMHYEPGADWWNDEWGNSIPDPLAEAALIGLFATAIGYSVCKTVCKSPCMAWVAEAPWKPARHGRNPLEALVRVRDNERTAT